MKKLKVLLASCALLFSTMGFVACGDGEDSFAWNAPVVENNIQQKDEQTTEKINDSVVSMMSVNFDRSNYKVVDLNYVSSGIVPVQNDAGYWGFYSLHYQKMLIAPQYKAEWTSYRIIPINQLGYLVQITYEDTIVTYDSMGNKVLYVADTDIYDVKPNEITYVMDTDSDVRYAQLIITVKEYRDKVLGGYEEVPSYARYDYATSECTLEGSLSYFTGSIDEEVYDGPQSGDLYVTENRIALDDFAGLEGHYIIKEDNVYYIFDSNDQIKNSYAVEPGYKVIQIGSMLICQEQVIVAYDEGDYDYCYNNGNYGGVIKVKLRTFSVDILEGTSKEINFNYAIVGNSIPYKGEDGKATYSMTSLIKVNGDKTVATSLEPIYCILNKDGKVVKELTGIPAMSFVKIGDNYYNSVNNVIYDKDLKELAYIGDINPQLDKVNQLFICSLDGKYGTVDYNGKVTIPFKYDSLNPLEENSLPINAIIDAKEDCILALKDEKIYKVNIRNGEENYICDQTSIREIKDDLYKISLYDGEFIKYIAQNQTYVEINNTSGEIVYGTINNNFYTFNSKINNVQYVFMADGKTLDNGTSSDYTDDVKLLKIYTFNVNNFANHDTFVTIGTEITEDVMLGRYYGDKITMNEGENKLHEVNGGSVYATFTPTESGIYAFVSDDLTSIKIMDELFDREIELSYADYSAETQVVVFDLEKDKEYTIILELSDDYEVVTIERPTEGKYAEHPISVMNFEEGDIKVTLPAGQKYVYVGIAPSANMMEFLNKTYTVKYSFEQGIAINYTIATYNIENYIYSEGGEKSWLMPISSYLFEIVRDEYEEEQEITFNFTSNVDKSSLGTVYTPIVLNTNKLTTTVRLGRQTYTINEQNYDIIIRRYVKYENTTGKELIVNLDIDNTASTPDYGCVVSTNGFVTPYDLVIWYELSQKVTNQVELTEEEQAEYDRLLAVGIIGGATDSDYNCELKVENNKGLYVFFMGPQTGGIDVTVTEYAINSVNDEFELNNYGETEKVYFVAEKTGYYNFEVITSLIDASNPDELVVNTSRNYTYNFNYTIERVDGSTYSNSDYFPAGLFLNAGDVMTVDFTLTSSIWSYEYVEVMLALVNGEMPSQVTFEQADETTKTYVYTATKNGYVYLETSAILGENPFASYNVKYTKKYTDDYANYTYITPSTPIYLTKGEQIVVGVELSSTLSEGDIVTIDLAFKDYATAGETVDFVYAETNPVTKQYVEYTIEQSGFYMVNSTATKVVAGTDQPDSFYNYTGVLYYNDRSITLGQDYVYLNEGEKIVIMYSITTTLVEGEMVNITTSFDELDALTVNNTSIAIENASEKYQLNVAEDGIYQFVLTTDYYGRYYTSVNIIDQEGNTVYSVYTFNWEQLSSNSDYKNIIVYNLPAGLYSVQFQRSTSYDAQYAVKKLNDVTMGEETYISGAKQLYKLTVAEDTNYLITLKANYNVIDDTKVIIRDENGYTKYVMNSSSWAEITNTNYYQAKYLYNLTAGTYIVEFQRDTSYSSYYEISEYANVEEFNYNSNSTMRRVFNKQFDFSNRNVRINITNNTDSVQYYEIATNLSNLRLIGYPDTAEQFDMSISNGQIIKLAPSQSIAITGVAYNASTTYKFELFSVYNGNTVSYSTDGGNTTTYVSYKVYSLDEYKSMRVKLLAEDAIATVYKVNSTKATQVASTNGSTLEGYMGVVCTMNENVVYIVRVTSQNDSNIINNLYLTDVNN